jgi:hypothetical protein
MEEYRGIRLQFPSHNFDDIKNRNGKTRTRPILTLGLNIYIETWVYMKKKTAREAIVHASCGL